MRRYSLKFKTASYTAKFSIFMAVTFALLLWWGVNSQITHFKNYHAAIAQHAIDNVALNIPNFIKERQRLVALFISINLSLLQQQVNNPDDDDINEKLANRIKTFFPQSHAFTIADNRGQPIIDDFDGNLLASCTEDLKSFSQIKTYQPYIHPNPEMYHFDIMQSMNINQQNFILFISFEANVLAKFLKSVQTTGHLVMLVYPEKNMLLEVTAKGARNTEFRPDYRLTLFEQQRFIASKAVALTRWQVVDSWQSNTVSDFSKQQFYFTGAIYGLFLIFLVFMTSLINKEQKKVLQGKEKLEAINLNLTDEVRSRTEEIEAALLQQQKQEKYLMAEEQVASLGRMVSGISHEISTPIGNAIMGNSFLQDSISSLNTDLAAKKLKRSKLTSFIDKAQKITTTIELSLENAATLIKSFKSVAVEQSHETLRQFFLKEYIDDILRSMHNQLKKTQISLVINCDVTLQLNSYPGYFSQILNNLINNSLLHGFEQGQTGNITIDISKHDNQLTIIYQDTGKGIAQENIDKIFEPFFSTKRGSGGTGQGLFIIARIIQSKFNGTIECFSEENQGVRFEIKMLADFANNKV